MLKFLYDVELIRVCLQNTLASERAALIAAYEEKLTQERAERSRAEAELHQLQSNRLKMEDDLKQVRCISLSPRTC